MRTLRLFAMAWASPRQKGTPCPLPYARSLSSGRSNSARRPPGA
jgi:hypothetical protein